MHTQHSTSWMRKVQYAAIMLFVLLAAVYSGDLPLARAQGVETGNLNSEYVSTRTIVLPDGNSVDETIISGPPTPPPGYELERRPVELPESRGTIKTLTVPAFDWVFGCSAVSGAMIAGYYDRNSFPNMYTGPTNGGVMPLDNSSWPTWSDGYVTYPNLPLAASHQGVDGRTTKGSIDDYWVKYLSTTSDPYITGGWTQHTWNDAIGDYMKTSQSSYGNKDGSTTFYTWTSKPDRLTCADMVTNNIHTKDGTYGRKLFYEARGYTVTDCYNQKTDNNSGGFTFAMYKAEINANRPVMLNLAGHTIVGVGYDDATNKVYIHDTWDYSNHTMTWGGSYSGMVLQSVSIVNLAASSPTVPTPISPSGTITDKTPTYKWIKVSGATQYSIQLVKGTTTVYTKTTAGTCGTKYCTYTPTTTLGLFTYKWRIRAKIGGVWKAYSPYKTFTIKTETGFNTDFNGTAPGWSVVKGTWGFLSSAYYKTAGIVDKWSSIVHVNNYPKLDYQARMRRKGCLYCSNNLAIRSTVNPLKSDYLWNKAYLFQYSNDKYFSVWEVAPGGSTALKGWTYYAGLNAYSWNTLRVTASSGSLKFYINGSLVWSGSDPTLTTGQVGIMMYRYNDSDTDPEQFLVDWAKLSTAVSSPAGDETLAEVGEEVTGWADYTRSPER